MKRLLVRSLVLGLAAACLLAVAPAAAKIPYFSVEVTPSDPVDGDAVVVVLRMWDDAAHTQPATWGEELMLGRLLEFRGDAGIVPITLRRFDDASYRAEVTLEVGTWRLILFPLWGGDGLALGAGYSAPASVTVLARPDYSRAAAIAAAGTLGILGVLVGGIVRRGTRRRPRSGTG